MSEKVRKHMLFKGRVQGVGFRFVASYSAVNIGVTGWIQNLWEMEVQGTSQQINLLLQKLYESPYIQIEDIDVEKIPLKEESEFRVLDY